jgi:hypothetical protein
MKAPIAQSCALPLKAPIALSCEKKNQQNGSCHIDIFGRIPSQSFPSAHDFLPRLQSGLDPNKISGLGKNCGLLVHVLPGPNKQRARKAGITLS